MAYAIIEKVPKSQGTEVPRYRGTLADAIIEKVPKSQGTKGIVFSNVLE